MGWQWDFGRFPPMSNDPEATRSLGRLAGSILEHFASDAVESKVEDIGVQLDLHEHQLRILDTTPGGNGLSEALLTEAHIRSAFQELHPNSHQVHGQRGHQSVQYLYS